MASSHRKCAISDIAITSARNNIFWQDKKQLIGNREGFIYFRSRVGQGACQHPNIPLLYIKLCIYRGWQASHRKCAISDIAITSARNNIFWQDKKQLIGHREGFIYFRSRGVQGACQHPNVCIYLCMYVSLLYIKLCIYRGWQASHRKCAISDIAITSARNNIFWQDKKQLIGHRKGFIYFWYRGVQGACQHPNICMYVCIVAYTKPY